MKRTLKYGLTTALRSFEQPDLWTKAKITTSGPIHVANEAYKIKKGTSGDISLHQTVSGDEEINLNIVVEENCHINLTDTIEGDGNLKRKVFLDIHPKSSVNYVIVSNPSTNSLVLVEYEATIVHSTLSWLFIGVGADTTQAFVSTNAGERSEVKNNAVLFGTGKQQFDIHVATNHTGAHSKSDMLTRSVLDDSARAVYHGLIHIGPNAPECDSYQKDEVILLSDRAGADAIPNLEIQNNKVRCTHGATIGKLDSEKMFYLCSRGITEKDAKRIITEGFLLSLTPESLHELIKEKSSA